MKTVIIIGGGISGLTAGITALNRGYKVNIIEKNPIVGGECMGWTRKGYNIDNCVDYMVIGYKDSPIRKLWEKVGALNIDTKLIYPECFYSVEIDNEVLSLYSNLSKTQEELLKVAHEDEKELKLFFKAVEDSKVIVPPTSKPIYKMNLFELIKIGKEFSKANWVIKKYSKMPMKEFLARFKNNKIRKLLGAYFNDIFTASQLIISYSFFTHKNAAIISGGSKQISQRMAKKFLELGGNLILNKSVEKMLVENRQAIGVKLNTGEILKADYFIPALDLHYFFSKILDESFTPKSLQKEFDHPDEFQIMTSFHLAFGINGTKDYNLHPGTFIFDINPIKICNKTFSSLGIKFKDEDTLLFPKDKRVIQISFYGDRTFYDFFKTLYQNKDEYYLYKNNIAKIIQKELENKYPLLKGNLILLDTYTPITYERYCNAYEGSYMGYFPKNGLNSHKNTIKKLKNVFLASQWLNSNGGLPYALVNGKFAADSLK